MALTSYDEIYQFFLNNISVDNLMLPSSIEGQYEAIRNGISHYNNITRENVIADDETETVNVKLNNDQILILAHCMKLILLQNILMYKNSIMIPFTKEIGVKNVGDQIKSIQASIEEEKNTIGMLIFNADDTTIM